MSYEELPQEFVAYINNLLEKCEIIKFDANYAGGDCHFRFITKSGEKINFGGNDCGLWTSDEDDFERNRKAQGGE